MSKINKGDNDMNPEPKKFSQKRGGESLKHLYVHNSQIDISSNNMRNFTHLANTPDYYTGSDFTVKVLI